MTKLQSNGVGLSRVRECDRRQTDHAVVGIASAARSNFA